MSDATTCNPIAVLERFHDERFPSFDLSDKHIDVVDRGDVWTITYVTPIEAFDEDKHAREGSFPILVVDKKSCSIVKLLLYQD
jgi:hypothetical protein